MKIEDTCVFKIKSVYSKLRLSEQKAADFVLTNYDVVTQLSIKQFSDKAGVSEPTIIRFVKAAGYKGYADFKLCAASEKAHDTPFIDYTINKKDNITEIPQKITTLTTRIFSDFVKELNLDDYKKAIEWVTNANTIDIYGVENSSAVKTDLMGKLLHLGLNCRSYSDMFYQQICAEHLTKNDVAIAISYSGLTKITVDTLKIAKSSGAKTVVITAHKDSVICNYADIVFVTPGLPTSLGSEWVVSRTAQMLFIDILYTGIVVSNYARFSKSLDKSGKNMPESIY